jgi:hypothetical protein
MKRWRRNAGICVNVLGVGENASRIGSQGME